MVDRRVSYRLIQPGTGHTANAASSVDRDHRLFFPHVLTLILRVYTVLKRDCRIDECPGRDIRVIPAILLHGARDFRLTTHRITDLRVIEDAFRRFDRDLFFLFSR